MRTPRRTSPSRRSLAAALAALAVTLLPVPAVAAGPTSVADLATALCAGGGATVTLGQDITETETLTLADGCTAILDLNGYDLTVDNVDLGTESDLTIRDTSSGADGHLVAEGLIDRKAGIRTTGSTLTIASGRVTASGGEDAAGIGGNDNEGGGTLIISGGTVTAAASSDDSRASDAAAIGGGAEGPAGTITISGGTVTATAHLEDGYYGAGIGSGGEAGTGSITISGGTVTATASDYAAGIGGGYASVGDTIVISGGTVTAIGGDYGAGIGTGQSAEGTATITISGGTITATGGTNKGAGIGGGDNTDGGTIAISGGTVAATGGVNAAGIGGGEEGDGGDITITGGSITATSGFDAAWYGIGGGGAVGDLEGTVTLGAGATRTDLERTTTITFAGSDSGSGTGSGDAASSTPVLTAAGAAPTPGVGVGVRQDASGAETPLTVSSPGAGQVRYSGPGMQLTLTGAPGSGGRAGLVVDPSGAVECELCASLPDSGVIEVWIFSEPRLVAAARLDEIVRLLGDLPCRRFTIPLGAPLDGGLPLTTGPHTLQLVLPTASGLEAVNVGVTLATGPLRPTSIPAGTRGPLDVERTAPVAAGLAVLGLAGIVLRRRTVKVG